MAKLTHNELVHRAAMWARRKGWPLVVAEMSVYTTTGEIPDVLAFKNGATLLMECKTSRSDFLADAKKPFRKHATKGMGAYRAYVAPKGVIKKEDLPRGWWLLEVHGSGLKVVVGPKGNALGRRPFLKRNYEGEQSVLLSAIRRLGVKAGRGISVRIYTVQTKRRAGLYMEKSGDLG